MKITINIDERTGTAIRDFCKANNLRQNQYLVDIIERQFNIDRFGDMNDIVGGNKKPKPTPIKMEKVAEPEQISKNTGIQNTEAHENTEMLAEKRKTVKRILKTK